MPKIKISESSTAFFEFIEALIERGDYPTEQAAIIAAVEEGIADVREGRTVSYAPSVLDEITQSILNEE